MNLYLQDPFGNVLTGKTVKFYAVGDTETTLYAAITGSRGEINLDDYDGLGNPILEGLYDLKAIACAEDNSDLWEYRCLISKGKLAATSDDNLNQVILSDDGATLYVYASAVKKASIDIATGRITAEGGFNEDTPS